MKRNNNGFTLVEMMIVVAMIVVIAAIAIPSYRNSVMRSKRSIGQAELLRVLSQQEQYFVNNKVYATNLTALGYAANPYYIDDNGNSTAAGTSIYQIALAAGASTTAFTLQAVPQNGQADDTGCATLQLSSLGTKSISGGTLSATDCW